MPGPVAARKRGSDCHYLMGPRRAIPLRKGGEFWKWRGSVLLRLRLVLMLACAPFSAAVAGESFTTYGDVTRYALPAGAVILALPKDDTAGLKQLLASGGVTLAATYALKYAVDDTRPNGGRRSFPSGHTAWAFTGAAYIHHRYGWQWGLPAEIAATAVAVSRVDGDFHRWRDVIASAAIAHASAFFLVDRLDERVTLMPMIGGREPAFGITGTFRF
jgi:membrane-associated phospholipid phosphatase